MALEQDQVEFFCNQIKGLSNLENGGMDIKEFGDFDTSSNINDSRRSYYDKHVNDRGDIVGYVVGKNKLERIISETNCDGIRIYFGWNDDLNSPELHLVPIDDLGNDISKQIESGDDAGKSFVISGLKPCPEFCSVTP